MTRDMLPRKTGILLAAVGVLAAGSACRDTPAGAGVTTGQHSSAISGKSGTAFDLTARAGFISTPDGASIPTWGYADGAPADGGLMQYPGPTLIVEQGQEITVTLWNELGVPVSILFPGQSVTATGGVLGELTSEAPPGQSVTYTFRATRPGTFPYYSGTQSELQVEMGLVGALIVRPFLGASYAYDHADTRFDREALFLLTEMDPVIHDLVATGLYEDSDFDARWPVYWFINGRAAPDTMLPDEVGWLPNQPYGCTPHMHPGERMLMRVVGAGLDLHPFHHHGNHARVIAVDGRLLESAPGAGPDLSHEVFTIQSVPGETVDAFFEWTGKGLGWDIYGDAAANPHQCIDLDLDSFDDTTKEYCPDHGTPLPVTLPQAQNVTFGGFYQGTPYLGVPGMLPPGEGGMNPPAAFPFMWHSHTEKEMVNNDIFPGGMMTMLMIEPPGVPVGE
jgi:hypothetical protein